MWYEVVSRLTVIISGFDTDAFALKMWTWMAGDLSFSKEQTLVWARSAGYMDGTDHPMMPDGRQSHKQAVFDRASMEQWFHMKYAPCPRIWFWRVGNGFHMVLLCVSAQCAQTASFLQLLKQVSVQCLLFPLLHLKKKEIKHRALFSQK